MNRDSREPAPDRPAPPDDNAPAEVEFPRRRLGRIVHDERGNASMEWERFPDRRAPRVPLSIADQEGQASGQLRVTHRVPGGAFEPYGREAVRDVPGMGSHSDPPRKPKDLRKLGEWLKMMRELGQRKQRSED